LDLETVQNEVVRQTLAVAATVDHILTYAHSETAATPSTDAVAESTDAPTMNSESSSTHSNIDAPSAEVSGAAAPEVTAAAAIEPTMWALPLEVTDVASNVQRAIATRKHQALSAIAQAATRAEQQPTSTDNDATI
jgi:hypothetical protein